MSLKQIEADRQITLNRHLDAYENGQVTYAEFLSKTYATNAAHDQMTTHLLENRAYRRAVKLKKQNTV
jgi:hypothetical protein